MDAAELPEGCFIKAIQIVRRQAGKSLEPRVGEPGSIMAVAREKGSSLAPAGRHLRLVHRGLRHD
jgi:hypothetical protein